MSIDVKYSISAKATGGRDGHSRTEDGAIDVKLATPKALGGSGDGNNPEQLFAAGYAACFLGAMKFAVSQDDNLPAIPDDAEVNSTVGIGPRSNVGFGLTVALDVSLPGIERDVAEKVVEAGHTICPYSHATKGNIEVTTELS